MKSMGLFRVSGLVAGLFVTFLATVSPQAAPVQDSPASAAQLDERLRDIQAEFHHLQDILLVANLAADPSARAAAVRDATASLSRLAHECDEAEGIYGKLQHTLPSKVDAASRPRVVADLAAIRSGLGEARKQLASTSSLVASAR